MAAISLTSTVGETGLLTNLRKDYFSTPKDTVLSVVCIGILTLVVWQLIDWAFIGAVWTGGPEVCRGAAGACWAVISNRYRLILFGLYPYEEQWRSAFACLAILVTVILSCVPLFWSAMRLALLWIAGFGAFYILMRGGIFGLSVVLETQWGGLALTTFVFSLTVLIGMPFAVVLALLRRSKLPVVSYAVAIFIDGIRSIPLVAILFAAAIILPFALPGFLVGDKLYRVIVGSAVFFAVYQAEVVRAGIQALPRGQQEASTALGLNYWQSVTRIILPQAFRYALPPTISQVVTAFMDTALIVVLGFFEVTASGNAAFSSGGWNAAFIEVYVTVGLIYFVFTFSLSKYGAYLERKLKRAAR